MNMEFLIGFVFVVAFIIFLIYLVVRALTKGSSTSAGSTYTYVKPTYSNYEPSYKSTPYREPAASPPSTMSWSDVADAELSTSSTWGNSSSDSSSSYSDSSSSYSDSSSSSSSDSGFGGGDSGGGGASSDW